MNPALALSGGTVTWYVARATGIVTLGFLTASVLLGILTSFRWSSPRWPRFVVELVHRNVSLLVLVFLAIHVVTVVVDSFAPIRWIDVVVPFVSAYRPFWLGLGTVAFDLLVALVVTSLLRHRIGFTAWRFVHWFAYACWPVAVVHGLGTGSDTKSGVLVVVTAVCVVSVLVAAGLRIVAGFASRPRERGLGVAAVVVAPVLLVVWLVSGPLADGWARKAGTPSSVLAASSSGSSASGGGTTSGDVATTAPHTGGGFPSSGFDATAAGTLRQSAPDSAGRIVLSLAGTLSGGTTGTVDVELNGTPLAGGGISMRTGTVTLSDGASSYRGAVTGLGASQVAADMPGPGGTPWRVTLDFTQLDQQRGTMTADVHAGAVARAGNGGDDR